MSMTTIEYVDVDIDEARSTRAARLAATPKVDVRVMVTRVTNPDDAHLLGQIGTLQMRDNHDPMMTFRVGLTDADGDRVWRWVHDVKIVDEVEPVDRSVEVADQPHEESVIEAKNREIVRLQAELEAARQTVAMRGAELLTFKEQVRDKAIEVAEEQNWCDDGLNEVLEELGLEPKRGKEVRFVVTLKVTMTGRPNAGHDGDDADFIRQSLQYDAVDLRLDGDWDEYEVEEIDVEGIEDVEETE